MRELKFRMKIKGDAKIWEVYAIDWLNLKALRDISGSMEWIDFEKIEQFLQYTGSKDSKNVEIYEGDIVKIKDGIGGIQEIEFSKNGYWNCKDKDPDAYTLSLATAIQIGCEVIGNIWEDKNLLVD